MDQSRRSTCISNINGYIMPFLIIIYQFIDQIMFIVDSPEHNLQYLSIIDQNGQHYYMYIVAHADVHSCLIF